VAAAEAPPLDAYDEEDLADVAVAGLLMFAAAVVSFLSLIVVTVGAAHLAGDLYEMWQHNRRSK
jgi:hypothetical protein